MIGDIGIFKDFRIMDNKGIHLNINGFTFSIQIGAANYCDNYNEIIGSERDYRYCQSNQAEIAVWVNEGNKRS